MPDAPAEPAQPTRHGRFHHGNLRVALVAAGVDLARAGGPGAVVLREATRRAGVVPNAAYRHFTDRGALLRAVSEVALAQLAAAMTAEEDAVPGGGPPAQTAAERLRAAGRGYLRYAQDEPGLFRAAFAGAGAGAGAGANAQAADPASIRSAPPYRVLAAAVDDLVTAELLHPDRRPEAELLAWATVHGLAMLLIDGPLRLLGRQHAEALGERLLEVVDVGLIRAPSAPVGPE